MSAWKDGAWKLGAWKGTAWASGEIVPPEPTPEPVTTVPEPRRWSGPSYILYTDDPVLARRKREDEEIGIS